MIHDTHGTLRRCSHPDTRLITFAADVDGTDTAEITHEALFEHWEALQTWLTRAGTARSFRLTAAIFPTLYREG